MGADSGDRAALAQFASCPLGCVPPAAAQTPLLKTFAYPC